MFDQDQGHSYRLNTLSCRLYIFLTLVGFTNNSPQMSSMMRRCALHMFDHGLLKVKVIVLKWHGTYVKYHKSTCAERMFDQGHFNVKVKVLGQTSYYCIRSISFEHEVGFTNNCTNFKYDGSMCSARLNIAWLGPFTMFKMSDYHLK